jgi:hypothetical protein
MCPLLSLARWEIQLTLRGRASPPQGFFAPARGQRLAAPPSALWDRDGFSSSPSRHLHCAARAWSRWARRAGSLQPLLEGREGDVSYPPGAASGRPVAVGGRGGTCPSLSPSSCAIVVLFYKP